MVAIPADKAQVQLRGRLWVRRLDGLLGMLILVLAFLAASFTVRNGDFWFHLATGRLLAQGQYSFGVDPFAYTTEGVYWANHSWLFDLVLYGLYGLIGGAGLVVLKAVLVTALAGLLLSVRRPTGAAWLSAVCTVLAVLAMSPRLLLQPGCVSYLLLGLTFWLLWQPHRGEGTARGKSYYLLVLVVLALWVNVDEWFLLGPVLVALFWLGERLGSARRTPGWLVPAGLAACLLNPHTYHAFTLPAELSPVLWTSGLRQDVRFQTLFASPWQASTYLRPAVFRNAAALAYFALTALGLVSFLLYQPALRGWRFIVWLPFAALAAWQIRGIPFFAVVASPITALNLQDFCSLRFAARHPSEQNRGRMAGRLVLVLSVLGLIFLAWPGWLQGYGRVGLEVAWGIQADPSLQRAAETLHAWRSRGELSDGEHVLALHPEVAQYAAWFCPGEKHFFDHRYPLFPQVAGEYEVVCGALYSAPEGSRRAMAPGEKDWRRVLQEHGVRLLVLYDPDWRRLFTAERRLSGESGRWTLLDVAGRTLIFGRKDTSVAKLAFDPDRLAYGPPREKDAHALPAAPQRGPERGPQPNDFWTRYAQPAPPTTWESDAAFVYLRFSEETNAREAQTRLLHSRSRYVAGLVGLPALATLTETITVPMVFRFVYQPLFLTDAAEREPALPLLAVRAARLALTGNPDDDNAYLRLALAYTLLRDSTFERSALPLLPPLAMVRHVQIVTALEHALRRNPDLELAHQLLANRYRERHFLDAALEHRREELRLSRQAGPRSGEESKDFAARLEQTEKAIAQLEGVVLDRRSEFALRSPSLHGDPVRQARLALEMGLARQALDDILLPSQGVLLGGEGAKLELELLLLLGRADEARNSLRSEAVRSSKAKLGVHDVVSPIAAPAIPVYRLPTYEWLLCLQSAAAGDYAVATASLEEIRTRLRETAQQQQPLRQRLARLRALLPRLLLTELGMGAQPGSSLVLPLCRAGRMEAAALLSNERNMLDNETPILRAEQADLLVVEGMLALERGAPDEAQDAFKKALELCPLRTDRLAEFAGWPIALGYWRRIQKQMITDAAPKRR